MESLFSGVRLQYPGAVDMERGITFNGDLHAMKKMYGCLLYALSVSLPTQHCPAEHASWVSRLCTSDYMTVCMYKQTKNLVYIHVPIGLT